MKGRAPRLPNREIEIQPVHLSSINRLVDHLSAGHLAYPAHAAARGMSATSHPWPPWLRRLVWSAVTQTGCSKARQSCASFRSEQFIRGTCWSRVCHRQEHLNVRHCRKINLQAIEDVERRVCSRTRADALECSSRNARLATGSTATAGAADVYEAHVASGEQRISLHRPDTALVSPTWHLRDLKLPADQLASPGRRRTSSFYLACSTVDLLILCQHFLIPNARIETH